MPAEPSAYDILGLPRSAATSQIRARYRQMVRRYQVARSTEQLFEDDKFLRIVRAYLLLDSPSRREYDRDLRAAKRTGVPLPDLLTALSPQERVLLGAEIAFIRGDAQEAARLTKTVLDTLPREARAWALLGEILTVQGKYDEAISVLNYSIQFDPHTTRYWDLLNEATALRDGRAAPRAAVRLPTGWERPGYVWGILGGVVVLIALSLFWVKTRLSGMEPWHAYGYDIPKAAVVVGAVDAFVLALALSLANLLDRFDDELVYYQVWYEVAGGRDVTLVPLGLILIPVGLICSWLALGFYAVISYMDQRASVSVSLALGLTGLLTALLTAITPTGRWAFFVLGGNAVYAGMMLGWFAGSQRRVVWRRVE